MGEARPGRRLAITGDTAPCRATVEAARGADLLVHDASFAEEEAQRAADTGHSTVGQAAAVGREAEVKMLALVHISSRYHVGKVLEEAREVYEPSSRRATSTWSSSPSPSAASPSSSPTAPASGASRVARNQRFRLGAHAPKRRGSFRLFFRRTRR